MADRKEMIQIEAKDGRAFVSAKAFKHFRVYFTMDNLIGDNENSEENSYSAPVISMECMNTVIKWAEHHADEDVPEADIDWSEVPMFSSDISEFCKELFPLKSVNNRAEIEALVEAASFLEARLLSIHLSKILAEKIRRLPILKIRKMFKPMKVIPQWMKDHEKSQQPTYGEDEEAEDSDGSSYGSCDSEEED